MNVTQRLVFGHNLNSDGLSFANDIGGLICPSLAVFRSDHEFSNYGKITLLMDKSKVNLRQDPTHNSDVFSTRFPPCYYKSDDSVLNAFSDKVAKLVPEYKGIHCKADYHESSITGGGFERVAEEYMKDPKILMAYAREQGISPRIYKTVHSTDISFIEKPKNPKLLIKQLKSLDVSNIDENHPNYLSVSKLIYQEIERAVRETVVDRGNHKATEAEISEDMKYFMDSINKRNFKITDNGVKLNFSTFHKLTRYFDNVDSDPNPIDLIKTRGRLEKLVSTPKQKDKFNDWLSKNIEKAFHSPHMHVMTKGGNRKKLAFTAENVFKAMKGKVNGTEKTIFMGAGSLRSLVAQRISSFRDMTSRMDNLSTEEDMKSIQSSLNDRLSDLPNLLSSNYLYDTSHFRFRDAVYEEIADFAKYRNPRSLESFKGIEGEKLEHINQFLDDLRDAPSHYFEIKKQSIVSISDFDAAVIPKGTSKDTVQILREANVRITYYDPEIKLDRIRAVNKHQELLLGQGEDVVLKNENDSLEPSNQ
jgi:hypothetical protein